MLGVPKEFENRRKESFEKFSGAQSGVTADTLFDQPLVRSPTCSRKSRFLRNNVCEICDQVVPFSPTMSSPTEETPEISQEEQKKLDLEAAVKEKQEQDGKSFNLLQTSCSTTTRNTGANVTSDDSLWIAGMMEEVLAVFRVAQQEWKEAEQLHLISALAPSHSQAQILRHPEDDTDSICYPLQRFPTDGVKL